jgi:putative SOS response-associated peptidase YedK
MPVLLNSKTKDMWLDSTYSFQECFKEIYKAKAYEGLTFYEVGDLVNKVKNDTPDCLLKRKEYEE